MKRYLIVLFVILNFPTLSLGCVCADLDSTNVKDWINKADFVIEGEYLTNINPNSELRDRRNQQNLGYDILFKVTSVIKGTISTDTIALVQFHNGSCTETFELGEKYIILGVEVLKFDCLDESQLTKEIESGEEIPPTYILPPSYVDEQGTMRYNNCDQEDSDYWNAIADKYITSYVSYCTAYPTNSRTSQLIKQK